MKDSIDLQLDSTSLAAMRTRDRKAISAALERVLRSADRSDSTLSGFLGQFCTGVRESYGHGSLMVQNVEVLSRTKGTVEVSFMGDTYMGCKDANYTNDHYEVLEYEVDFETGELRLTGDFPERSRSTKEEL